MHGEGSRGRRVDTMGEGQVPGVGALSLKGVKAIGRMKDRPTNRHKNTENSASTLAEIFGARVCRVTFKSFKKTYKNLKIAPQGARGWGSEFKIFTRIFIYILKGKFK